LTIDNTDGDERLLLPLLSTAECATVLNAAGEVAYDEATNRIKMYGAALNSVVTTADVDDTPADAATTDPISSNWAYDHLNILTTAGDIPYATAARVWTRLAKGTANQRLSMNSGATAPEWATVTGINIVSSTYTGNGGNDRQITTGFTCKLVLLYHINTRFWICMSTSASVILTEAPAINLDATDLLLHATDGFVVDASSANANLETYYYMALG